MNLHGTFRKSKSLVLCNLETFNCFGLKIFRKIVKEKKFNRFSKTKSRQLDQHNKKANSIFTVLKKKKFKKKI